MMNTKTPQRLTKRPKRIDNGNAIPLAFSFSIPIPQVSHQVTVISWTERARSILLQLEPELFLPKPQLPIRSLRSRLEIAERTSLRLDGQLGFRGKEHTLLWCQRESNDVIADISNAIMGWLIEDVASFIREKSTGEELFQTLKQLCRDRQIVNATRRSSNPLSWSKLRTRPPTGTINTAFGDLADFVARLVEGKEVFTGCGPMRRIVGSDLSTGEAQLMTDPIQIRRGSFSLVMRFMVRTFPGRLTPIVEMHLSRRVWVNALKQSSQVRTLTGYALPPNVPRAFPFTLERESMKGEGRKRFQFGPEFAPLVRAFGTGVFPTVEDILSQGLTSQGCKFVINLKHGASTRSSIKSGVPDLDKWEAFKTVASIVADSGLIPWAGLELVASLPKADGMEQHWLNRDVEDTDKREEYELWRAEAEATIRDCYKDQYHLVIGIQRDNIIDQDAEEACARLKSILGQSITCSIIPLPNDVHGPRGELPGSAAQNVARAAERMKAWQPFIDAVRFAGQDRPVDGILIIARKWYGTDNSKPDDVVNKRAGRIALARSLKVPIQYFLPRVEYEDDAETDNGGVNERSFEQRLMMAWLDLAYKSIGRVRPGKLIEKAKKLYETEQLSFLDSYPDRIIGLGVVRRNKTMLVRNESSFMPYVIELDVASGTCRASFAYEDPATHQLTLSEMLPLPQALVSIASMGPMQLYRNARDATDYRKIVSQRTQAFFKAQLSACCRESLQPLIVVDADTSRYVWPWLKDDTIDPTNISLDGGYNEQSTWPHARFVRTRTNNAPKVIFYKDAVGTIDETGEEVYAPAPVWAEAMLFRLTDTVPTSHVYLSFGSIVRKQPRGRSCYHSHWGFAQKRPKNQPQYYEYAELDPYTDAWSTPSALEIVVVRPGTGEPHQTALLTTWLRQCYAHFGAWTTKPAPLFFEGVLKQYISDFELSDEEEEISTTVDTEEVKE